MATDRPSLVERFLRALVRLLPEDFRDEFGDSIRADLADRRAAGDRARMVRRDFPSIVATLVREHADALRQDFKYSLRMMARTPGFTALALLMLALGTGANVAMFSIIDAVLLRSPFLEPDRIVRISTVDGSSGTRGLTAADHERLAADNVPDPFTAVAALWGGAHVVTGAGDPFAPDVECVSPAMFGVLGTPPMLGRTLAPFDERPDASPALVLSYVGWQRLGASPSIVGSRLTVNATPVTVVGVMPRGFLGALSRYDTEMWLPLARPVTGGGYAGCIHGGPVTLFAQLAPGMSIDAAEARLVGYDLSRLDADIFGEYRLTFIAFTAAVACVLLIACFNVGGLQMERMLARQGELAVRAALGASRGRLIRQTLTENLLLAAAGTVAGVLTARLTLATIIGLLPRNVPHLAEVSIDGRALTVAAGLTALTGIIAGLLPLRFAGRVSPGSGLAGRTTRRGLHWTRRSLVIVEVALSIAVLVGAGLMIRTFLSLRPDNPGFDATRKMTMLVRSSDSTPEAAGRFFDELMDRLRATPGIGRVAGSSTFPMRGTVSTTTATLSGTQITMYTTYITSNYLDVLKIPVTMGRPFFGTDARTSPRVAIVNGTLAKRMRPDGRVVGERLNIREPVQSGGVRSIALEIVGVTADARIFNNHTQSRAELFIPFAQADRLVMIVTAEYSGRSEMEIGQEMRGAVRALRPDLVVEPPEAMSASIDRGLSSWRSRAWLLGVFASLAVTLAAIGLMTTIGWWVRQRTRELGIRTALGATRTGLARFVLRQGLTLAGLGILGGLGLAALLTRYVRSQLYGVTPLDPATFAACAILMLLVSVVAIWMPVRRATSIDPVVALRSE